MDQTITPNKDIYELQCVKIMIKIIERINDSDTRENCLTAFKDFLITCAPNKDNSSVRCISPYIAHWQTNRKVIMFLSMFPAYADARITPWHL